MSYRKLETWVPSLIPHSFLLDTCRQQPNLVSSTFSISLKSVLCCLFTHHYYFLTQDSITSFLNHLVTSHSRMCAHTVSISPAHKQTQKPKPTVKVVGGTVENFLSSQLITFIEHLPRERATLLRELRKLWSLPTDSLDNLVDCHGRVCADECAWMALIVS